MANTESVSLDPAGDLYITDNANNTVREVAAATANAIPRPPGQTSALVIAPAGTAPGGSDHHPARRRPGHLLPARPAAPAPARYVDRRELLRPAPGPVGATLTYNSGTQDLHLQPGPRAPATPTPASARQLTSETDTAGDTLTVAYRHARHPGTVRQRHVPVHRQSLPDHHRRLRPRPGPRLHDASDTARSPPSPTHGPRLDLRLHRVRPHLGHRPDGQHHHLHLRRRSTGNPLLANDLLTITSPNAQPGGPDAGDATVNVYNAAGPGHLPDRPHGLADHLHYYDPPLHCNPATGTGIVTVTDPDGNTTVYDYDQGTLAAAVQLD